MEMKKKRITPEVAAGFKDYLPEDMIPRQRMLDTIRGVFERFGFVPLDTPAIEKEEILTGGEENFRMQIFRTNVQVGWDTLALRFDLTVPLARVIAQYPNEVKKPFKRYQVGKVWRAEKPQAGRYREFIQFDADTVGSSSMMADAEIVAIMYATMKALGVNDFRIRVNNRKVLNGLPAFAGFPEEKIADVLRTIDKLDKQGWESVREELCNSVEKEGCGLGEKSADEIKRFLDIRGSSNENILTEVEKLMGSVPVVMEGVRELRAIVENVTVLGVPDDMWAIDLSVARGLGYYTGPVFETILTKLPNFGSVFSGGRYDGLVERFSDVSIPATGASVGVDRLFAAMQELGLISAQKTVTQVIILNFDAKCEGYVQEIATFVRDGGVSAEIYFGNESTIKGQLAFALNAEVPVIIIAGSNEKEKGTVQVKDPRARTQDEVRKEELLSKLREVLKMQ